MDNFVEDSCFGGKNISKEGGVGGKEISKEGQVFFSALGFSVRDDLLDCHPLMTIAPSRSVVLSIVLLDDHHFQLFIGRFQSMHWTLSSCLNFQV